MDGKCPQFECLVAQVAIDLVSSVLQLLFSLINLIGIAVVAGCRSND